MVGAEVPEETTLRVEPREPRPPIGPHRVLKIVGGPLVLYHLLIFAGAYLLVVGFETASRAYEIAGSALVGAGIGTEVLLLGWSARLVRRTAIETDRAGLEEVRYGSGRYRSLCPRCGRVGDEVLRSCPRCGGSTVRLSR